MLVHQLRDQGSTGGGGGGGSPGGDPAATGLGPGWSDVQRIAQAIGPQIRTASPDVRDRWHALQPRLAELERLQGQTGDHARQIARRKLATALAVLRRLQDDILFAAG